MQRGERLLPYTDKVMHFFAYGLLGILFFRALCVTRPHWPPAVVIMSSVLFAGLYGTSDEIHQMFVASRHADMMDGVADFLGGAAGVLGFYRITRPMARSGSMRSD